MHELFDTFLFPLIFKLQQDILKFNEYFKPRKLRASQQ